MKNHLDTISRCGWKGGGEQAMFDEGTAAPVVDRHVLEMRDGRGMGGGKGWS